MAVAVLLVVIFLPFINNPFVFVPLVLLTSLLPDIDAQYSFFGRTIFLRPFQFFVKHRGIVHSFFVCLLLSIAIALFYPPAAFPFFLGYSFHLIADSMTKEGIRPFWPSSRTVEGPIRTGGKLEHIVFFILLILILVRVISYF